MGTIAQKLAAVASSKAAIGTAIEGRGGTVPTKLSDYGTAVAALPNAYSSGDEGKVVSSGALVSQTSLSVTSNNTYDTTTKNSVVVAVPNTYAAGDEGKVVSNGALVSQTSLSVDENGTYDTTTKNSVTVNVSGGGGGPLVAVVSRQSSPTWTVSASDLAGATSIGVSAFQNCYGLTSITIPNSVTSISDKAFYNCSGLTSLTIPNSVTSMGDYPFAGSFGLTNVVIGSGLTSITSNAFYNCRGLTSIAIPDNVTSIKDGAFSGCSSLATIDFGTTRNTVPTLTSTDAFTGLPVNYQILVPAALLTDWKAANRWNNSAIVDHIVAHP